MKYIYGQSKGNTITYFSEPYSFDNSECCVVELVGTIRQSRKFAKDSLFLCCDFCEESTVAIFPIDRTEIFNKCVQLPILRRIHVNTKGKLIHASMVHPIWVKVIPKLMTSMRLYITNQKGEQVSFDECNLQCTLAFSKSE